MWDLAAYISGQQVRCSRCSRCDAGYVSARAYCVGLLLARLAGMCAAVSASRQHMCTCAPFKRVFNSPQLLQSTQDAPPPCHTVCPMHMPPCTPYMRLTCKGHTSHLYTPSTLQLPMTEWLRLWSMSVSH